MPGAASLSALEVFILACVAAGLDTSYATRHLCRAAAPSLARLNYVFAHLRSLRTAQICLIIKDKNNKALALRRGLLFSRSYYLLEFAPVLVVQVAATLLMWVTLIEAWLAEAPPADALGGF